MRILRDPEGCQGRRRRGRLIPKFFILATLSPYRLDTESTHAVHDIPVPDARQMVRAQARRNDQRRPMMQRRFGLGWTVAETNS